MWFPVVSDEKAGIEFARRQARIARNDAELRCTSAQISNLCRRKPETLKQQCPAIAFDRSDRRNYCLPRGVQNRVVVRIQNRPGATAKRERSREVLRRDVVIGWAVEPHAESEAVFPMNSRHVVLKLEMPLSIYSVPLGGRTAAKRSQHLQPVTGRGRSDFVVRVVNLQPDLVHGACG